MMKRGINGYFSFGTPVLRGRRETLHSLAPDFHRIAYYRNRCSLPISVSEALLSPIRRDLPVILKTIAHLREQAGSPAWAVEELETLIQENSYPGLW